MVRHCFMGSRSVPTVDVQVELILDSLSLRNSILLLLLVSAWPVDHFLSSEDPLPRPFEQRLARLQPVLNGRHPEHGTCHTESFVEGLRVLA